MKARMKNPALQVPAAMKALQALSKAAGDASNLPPATAKLVHLRASQINGCGVCVHMHARELKEANVSDEKIHSVAAWRETRFYSDAERAALALTESLTRLADRADGVPDDIWAEAARHYDETALSALILEIGVINTWNRLNAAVRQVAGDWG